MNGLDNEMNMLMLICANIIALLLLLATLKVPRVARICFALLFSWAAFTNWTTSQEKPEVYIEYADFAWIPWYRDFINGWFSQHIRSVVGSIAVCQAIIGLSFLFNGPPFTICLAGAIVFFLAILPLGVGAGFPSTAIAALACFILLKKNTRSHTRPAVHFTKSGEYDHHKA